MSARVRGASCAVLVALVLAAGACAHEGAGSNGAAAAPVVAARPTATATTKASAPSTVGAAGAASPATSDPAAAKAFREAVRGHVDALLAANPVRATHLGDHRWDDKWPDATAEGQAAVAKDFRERARALRSLAGGVPARVPSAEAAAWETDTPALDARLLADDLEAVAFALSDVRMLERSAAEIAMTIGSGVTSLTSQAFAPKRVRMARLAARLEAVPALLDTARGRLAHPSRASLDVMPIVVGGLTHSLRDDVAKTDAASLEGDEATRARLVAAATKAADALDAYKKAVAKAYPAGAPLDEQPLGPEKWGTLARLEEGVTEPPSAVRAMGEQELARLLGELDELVKKNGRPGETRAAFFHRVAEADPLPADKILDEYRASLSRVNTWLHAHPFATIPWDRVDLQIVPSPPERRGISFASINAAGPLEPTRGEAKFEVTAPDPTMSAAKRAALVAFHSRGAVDLVTVHEGLPGHDLQLLAQQKTPSLVRKVLWAATLGEGWAHYCEQAVVDGGYTGADPVRTRAFYLRMALQRAVRVVLDVGENDGSLTVDKGAKMLEEDAFLAPEAALMEARRAVVAPVNMFAYTYGKLAILKMRKDREIKDGAEFDLARFHDELLALGAIPVDAAARQIDRR